MTISTSLTLSHPLVLVNASPNAQVLTALTFPLSTKNADQKRQFWIHLLSQVSMLELTKSKLGPNHAKVNQIISSINALLASAQYSSLPEALEFSGLASLFPVSISSPNAQQALDLKPMVTLNQVIMLALQLRQDVQLSNHKYIAHQIALLYQSVSGTKDDLKKYRSLIETQFETIKAICSGPDPEPQLSPELKNWLHSVTTEILTYALFSNQYASPSQAVLEFMRSL